MTNRCQRCGKEVTDKTVCTKCKETLVKDLSQIPELVKELAITASRQNRQGNNDHRGNSKRPLPINLTAVHALTAIITTITSWSLLTAEEQPAALPGNSDTANLAIWLTHHTNWLTKHPAAADIINEIHHCVTIAEQAIDNREQTLFWGPCACGADLRALKGAVIITCTQCKSQHDASQRKTQLVEQAENVLATTTEIEHLSAQLGDRVSAATIRQWQVRGHVLAHSRTAAGIPLYRVGDVLDRLRQKRSRQTLDNVNT